MVDIWWNKHYKYRKNVTFDLTRGDITGHPAFIRLAMTPEQGKVRADLEDIRIVMNNVTVIDIDHYFVSHVGDGMINVMFEFPSSNLVDYGFTTDSSFYVYYGDIYLESPEAYNPGLPVPDPSINYTDQEIGNYVPSLFAETILAADSGGHIGLTRPGEDWVSISVDEESTPYLLSPQTARDAKLSYSFYGTSIGVYANVGPGYGIVRIELDDQSREIDLYEPEEERDVLIYRAYNLDYEIMHSFHIFNTGSRSPAASTLDSYYRQDTDLEDHLQVISPELFEPVNITKIGVSKTPIGILGDEQTVDTFNWTSKIGGIV